MKNIFSVALATLAAAAIVCSCNKNEPNTISEKSNVVNFQDKAWTNGEVAIFAIDPYKAIFLDAEEDAVVVAGIDYTNPDVTFTAQGETGKGTVSLDGMSLTLHADSSDVVCSRYVCDMDELYFVTDTSDVVWYTEVDGTTYLAQFDGRNIVDFAKFDGTIDDYMDAWEENEKGDCVFGSLAPAEPIVSDGRVGSYTYKAPVGSITAYGNAYCAKYYFIVFDDCMAVINQDTLDLYWLDYLLREEEEDL